jgi:solute carrier family 31 (copper transporter), member 1
LYGATVFVSFFLMLVFMTYNVSVLPFPGSFLFLNSSFQAYLIVATVVGAAIGHYIFQSELDVDAALAGMGNAKGVSCH